MNVTIQNGAVADATNGASLSNIKTVNIRNTQATGGTVTTMDASKIAGLTAVNSKLGTGDVTVTNLATGASAGMIGNGTVVDGVLKFGYAAAAGTLGATGTLNLAGGVIGTNSAIALNQTVATGNIQSVVVNSTGAANAIKSLDVVGTGAKAATSLTVHAATNADFGTGVTGFAGTTATITVDGAASSVKLGTLEAAVSTVNASGLTAGGITATLGAVTQTVTGGAGNDTITTAGVLITGSVNAGAGTADKLILAAATDLTAVTGAKYTNFEVLQNNGAASADVSTIAGVTSLITNAAGAGFAKMTAAQAANVSVTATLAATATAYTLATDTGVTDILGLNFANATSTVVENATALTVNGFETLNLTAGSGGTSLWNAAGTTQQTAGTNYDQFGIGVATTDLKAVTVAGAYAAQVALNTNATKVTSIDAHLNTAGVEILTGGQTGTLVVTGSDARDIVTMAAAGAGGLVTVNTGLGNDLISAAQADIAVATINGGGGIDTLKITDAGALTLSDATFANVSGIEKVNVSAATGLTFSLVGYANSLATANGGVFDFTAGALTAATTIDGTSLGAANSMKLTLANVDTAANATATTITLSQGADNITMTQAGAGNTDTITITGGVAALASTAAKTIDLSGVTIGGAITVTTGAGADTIKAAVGIAGTYTAGSGADTITLGATDAAAQTLGYSTANQSITTAYDKVSNFQMSAAGDLLDFATTGVLTSAQLATAGWTVTTGIATKTGATIADFITAFSTSTTAGAVAFSDGTHTYVGYSDGTAALTTSDQMIQLTGLQGATSVATGIGANVIGIV